MGEGQFDVADVDQDLLQKYDNQVEDAVNAGDEEAVRT
ncbi:MAG: PspA-associated protein PspAA, partial [Brevibacterium linens]